MRVAHRHEFAGAPLGWSPARNLFSLIFALILAVLFTILLLLFIGTGERKAPPATEQPNQAAELRIPFRP